MGTLSFYFLFMILLVLWPIDPQSLWALSRAVAGEGALGLLLRLGFSKYLPFLLILAFARDEGSFIYVLTFSPSFFLMELKLSVTPYEVILEVC